MMCSDKNSIQQNIEQINQQIRTAEQQYGRDSNSVQLFSSK